MTFCEFLNRWHDNLSRWSDNSRSFVQ